MSEPKCYERWRKLLAEGYAPGDVVDWNAPGAKVAAQVLEFGVAPDSPPSEDADRTTCRVPDGGQVLEALAALEHERWSDWERWRTAPERTAHDEERWRRQRDVPYADLSEPEKDSDRTEARRTLELLRALGCCLADTPCAAEPEECTGVAASWCPVHGDCTCAHYDDDPNKGRTLDDDDCPLHSSASSHGEAERRRTRPKPEDVLQNVIGFARETWLNDGAEGETVHLLCDELERRLTLSAVGPLCTSSKVVALLNSYRATVSGQRASLLARDIAEALSRATVRSEASVRRQALIDAAHWCREQAEECGHGTQSGRIRAAELLLCEERIRRRVPDAPEL